MIFRQITLIILFTYWILAHSYLLVTPSILLGNQTLINLVKELSQTFSTRILLDGFSTQFFMAANQTNIQLEINQNIDLIDIMVCNHVSTFDFLIAMAYLKNFNIGSYNFVLKNEITYFPGFGLIMYASPDIKLNRRWEQDKLNLGKQIDKIKTNHSDKQVILIFPEGTRLTKEKLLEGHKFSELNNLPIFENLLVPKTKGLWTLISHLSQTKRLGKIWDLTLAIPKFMGKSAYLTDIIGKKMGPVYGIFRELKNCQYQNLNEFKSWFIKNWQIKDELLSNYNKFIYNQIEFSDKSSHILLITLTIILSTIMLTNKYSRGYLLLSFLLAYTLIIFKL
jgi:hypothetical protein